LLRTVQEHRGEDLVVVLGATDPEVIKLVGETVTAGDPTWAGPLAGVALGLPVYHIFESGLKAAVPPEVYEEKVGPLEVLHDLAEVVTAAEQVRSAGQT
jgi:glycine/sarcosine/betaine reductase complex component A